MDEPCLNFPGAAVFCYKCESYRDYRCLDPFDYRPHVQVTFCNLSICSNKAITNVSLSDFELFFYCLDFYVQYYSVKRLKASLLADIKVITITK